MAWEAFIIERSPRFQMWIKVFGSQRVEVISPLPLRAKVMGRVEEVYLLDLKSLDEEQTARLITHLSETFRVPVEELAREIEEKGVPILAEDVAVPIPLRFFM